MHAMPWRSHQSLSLLRLRILVRGKFDGFVWCKAGNAWLFARDVRRAHSEADTAPCRHNPYSTQAQWGHSCSVYSLAVSSLRDECVLDDVLAERGGDGCVRGEG